MTAETMDWQAALRATPHGATYEKKHIDWLIQLHDALLPVEVDYLDLAKAAGSVSSSYALFKSKPATLASNTRQSAALLGITPAQFIKAALTQTQLFNTNPQTLAGNVEQSAAFLNIMPAEFIQMALKHTAMLVSNPQTLASNAKQSAELLKFTPTEFMKVALKQPWLFTKKPEILADNAQQSAALLKITPAEFMKAALKHPSMFTRKPETLADNARQSAALLEITPTEFTKAALKQPSLFTGNPETLAENAKQSAELLGITVTQFTIAALKQPSLFSYNPQTLASHGNYIKKIAQILNPDVPPVNVMLSNSSALTLSSGNLLNRFILAKYGALEGMSVGKALMVMPTGEVQERLVDHYQKTAARTGHGMRVLQNLHHIGALAQLPEGVEPLSDPRSLSILDRLKAEKAAAPKERRTR